MNGIIGDEKVRKNLSGICCLCFCAKTHDIFADPIQLIHRLGFENEELGKEHIELAAIELQLQITQTRIKQSELSSFQLPVMVEMADGEFIVLVGRSGDFFITYDPTQSSTPRFLSNTNLAERSTSRVLLVKRKYAITDSAQPFGIQWVAAITLQFRKPLSHILLATFLIQLFGLAMPLFSQVIFDKVLNHRSMSTLHVLGIGMVILMIFEALFSILKSQLLSQTSNKVDALIGSKIMRHLLNLPLHFFESRSTGSLVAKLNEMENLRKFITGAPVSAIVDTLFVGIFLAVLFWYSALLTLVVLAGIPLLIAIVFLGNPILRNRLAEQSKTTAANHSFLIEAISNVHSVKAFALEPTMTKRWEQGLVNTLTATHRVSNLAGAVKTFNQLIQRAIALAVLWIGAMLVMRGELTMGQLIAFQMLTLRVVQPMVKLAQFWQEFQQFALSIKELEGIMNIPKETARISGKHKLERCKGAICLSDVSFQYAKHLKSSIEGVNLNIRSGEMIGITGRSGSGKSTLAKLLQQFYVPTSGKIEVDGVNIAHFDPTWLRKQFGIVLQDSRLFQGTVIENLSMHLPHSSMKSIMGAAKVAEIHDFIMSLPEGYETRLAEGGGQMSGGQRQRLAIARAILGNPGIVILDEATSALDYETEFKIHKNLAQYRVGKTTIIIAHRLSTLREANKILVMDGGRIVESGTHHELVSIRGIYSGLLEQQRESYVSQIAY